MVFCTVKSLDISVDNQIMKGLFLSLAFVLAVIFLSGCTAPTPGVTVTIGQPFTLEIGQSAVVQNEGIRIYFVNVSADSRCPSGVQCIWAGEAVINLEAEKGGQMKEVVLSFPGKPRYRLFEKYDLEITSIEPYPKEGQEINLWEYKAAFIITEAKSGSEVNCTLYQVDNCPENCVICPPCYVCSSISCQTEEFCESLGFNRSWSETIVKRLNN